MPPTTSPALVRGQWTLPAWYGTPIHKCTFTVWWTGGGSRVLQTSRVVGAILSGWIGLLSDSGATWGRWYPRDVINYELETWVLGNRENSDVVRFSMNPRGNISHYMPPESVVMLRLLTGLPGRSFTGRVFLPWVDAQAQSRGRVNPLAATWLSRFEPSMRLVVGATGTFRLVVWSRSLSTPERPVFTPVTRVALSERIRWQRRYTQPVEGLTSEYIVVNSDGRPDVGHRPRMNLDGVI